MENNSLKLPVFGAIDTGLDMIAGTVVMGPAVVGGNI